ncbi:hypothetical protein G6F65_020154 [Rhizopus arrhizus]|nr:hypothetical protein G6F65_020154 [Rhizopus arrhizus]
MAVRQAGHQRHAGGVDLHAGVAFDFGRWRHARHPLAVDQHAVALQHLALAIEYLSADEEGLSCRRHVSLRLRSGVSLPPRPAPRGTWIAGGASIQAGVGYKGVADGRTGFPFRPLPAIRHNASRRRGRTSGGSPAGHG